jgi:hypothetical protein
LGRSTSASIELRTAGRWLEALQVMLKPVYPVALRCHATRGAATAIRYNSNGRKGYTQARATTPCPLSSPEVRGEVGEWWYLVPAVRLVGRSLAPSNEAL